MGLKPVTQGWHVPPTMNAFPKYPESHKQVEFCPMLLEGHSEQSIRKDKLKIANYVSKNIPKIENTAESEFNSLPIKTLTVRSEPVANCSKWQVI